MHLKKSLTAIVALVASIALARPAGAAMATDPLEEMEDAGRAFLTDYDVPSATQDELKKYENAAGPARANLTVIGSSIAGSSSSTLGLRVGAGGAYQVN